MAHPTFDQRQLLEDDSVLRHIELCVECRTSVQPDVDLGAVRERVLDRLDDAVLRRGVTAPPRRWRGVAVAAVLTLYLGVLTVLIAGEWPRPVQTAGSGDGMPVVDAPHPEPIEVAERFVDTRNAWDAESVQALFAPGATIQGDLVSRPEDYPNAIEFEQATGWMYALQDCTQSPSTGGTLVHCTFIPHNDWSRALDLDFYNVGNFRLLVAEGEIVWLNRYFDEGAFSRVWFEFMTWLEEEHPEGATLVAESFISASGIVVYRPRLTPEAAGLFERYTDEFVASVESP